MEHEINAIFSGGPANGKVVYIRDCPEYHVPVAPDINFSLITDEFEQARTSVALYRRTTQYDIDCNKIFEFCGIFS